MCRDDDIFGMNSELDWMMFEEELDMSFGEDEALYYQQEDENINQEDDDSQNYVITNYEEDEE